MSRMESNITTPDEIWKETAEKFQLQLQLRYKYIKDHTPPIDLKNEVGENTEGILVDRESPHSPALLLQEDGSLKYIQFGISPQPRENGLITGLSYCILATEIINNSSRSKKRHRF